MPIVYSINIGGTAEYYSSLTTATTFARAATDPATNGPTEAVIMQHMAEKANMRTILDALHGTGWADPANATVALRVRDGKKVKE